MRRRGREGPSARDRRYGGPAARAPSPSRPDACGHGKSGRAGSAERREGQEGQEGREGREGQEGQEGREGREGQTARRWTQGLGGSIIDRGDDPHPDPGLVRGSRAGLRQRVAIAAGEPAAPAGCRTDHWQRALRLGSSRRNIGGARSLALSRLRRRCRRRRAAGRVVRRRAGRRRLCVQRAPAADVTRPPLAGALGVHRGRRPARKRPLVATERHPRRASGDDAGQRSPGRAR